MRREEADGERRQEGARDDRRHVEPQRARRAVAEAAHRVERRRYLAEGRCQAVQQPGARLGRGDAARGPVQQPDRSEEHTSELQSLMRISYAVFCLKKKKNTSEINQDRDYNTQKQTQYSI